ncbi:YopJ family acetyltransferase [Xanthomonas translucens]|nr:YopJ family acetyltransferase [Xanthomonas translucens]MCC8448599.1 avirulence protein [Xanthomonas translucens pv. translucens]MCT8285431.1 avirulence protein [Xanthomonas translucens pv. translucens]MCT8303089.1 avirulence protein [Xanthomonas translucens pv. translucens]
MGLCASKPSVAGSPVAGSPEHHPTHATEQTTPSMPSSPEASMSPSLHDLAALGSPRARRARSTTSARPSGTGAMAGRASLPSSSSGPTLAAQLQDYIQALEHAELQGKQYPAAKLDQKLQPQMVAAQNHIHPKLDVKVFEASRSEPDALRQAIVNTRRGERWRAVVNVERIDGKGAPSHGIAVDVSGGRGKVSVLAVDSVWGCTDTLAVMTAALKGVKNAELTILNTGTQKDNVNCKIFALANAKAMADADDLMVDLHKKNFGGKIVGTGDTINGVDVTIARGSDVLDAPFFQHTTSKDVFDDLPVHIREPLEESFAQNFREIEAAGTRRAYNTSIEQERLKYLRDALAQCPGPSL